MDQLTIAAILLAVMLVLLASGLWIGLSLLLVGVAAIAFFSPAPVGAVVATTIWGNSAEWTMTALPMFLWMGEILFRTRLSEQMFSGLAPWLGWLPGRLWHVNTVGCAMFGAVSGSSAATCATISRIALPELNRRGYPEHVTLGSLAGAGTLGILIPPSVIMIVYAVASEVSIIQMFIAGIIPGLMVTGLFSAYLAGWALLHPERVPPNDIRLNFGEKLWASRRLIPCMLLILAVIGSLMFGIVTATEAGALGVAGALVLAGFTGTLTWSNLVQSAMGAMRITCMIALILAGSEVLGVAMGYTGIPRALAEWVGSLALSPYALIAILCVVYLILGTALEGVGMILITTSIVLPMIQAAGFDLIWFGIFIVLLVELAELTPPVGFNLFVLQTMTGRDSTFVARAALPFFFLLLVAVAIITVFPGIVTWLPKTLTAR